MATKNISITKEAYDRLAAHRQAGESFSEIIKRITHARGIMEFAGILSQESADALENNVQRVRALHKKNAEERIARIRKQFS